MALKRDEMLHVCCTKWGPDGSTPELRSIRRLPSRRYQASYAGPDLQRHVAPVTFTSAADAETWLSDERRLVESETWRPPAVRLAQAAAAAAAPKPVPLTVETFAEPEKLLTATDD